MVESPSFFHWLSEEKEDKKNDEEKEEGDLDIYFFGSSSSTSLSNSSSDLLGPSTVRETQGSNQSAKEKKDDSDQTLDPKKKKVETESTFYPRKPLTKCCRFYLTSSCNRGKECKYVHPPGTLGRYASLCHFWKDKCPRMGTNCPFFHPLDPFFDPSTMPSPPTRFFHGQKRSRTMENTHSYSKWESKKFGDRFSLPNSNSNSNYKETETQQIANMEISKTENQNQEKTETSKRKIVDYHEVADNERHSVSFQNSDSSFLNLNTKEPFQLKAKQTEQRNFLHFKERKKKKKKEKRQVSQVDQYKLAVDTFFASPLLKEAKENVSHLLCPALELCESQSCLLFHSEQSVLDKFQLTFKFFKLPPWTCLRNQYCCWEDCLKMQKMNLLSFNHTEYWEVEKIAIGLNCQGCGNFLEVCYFTNAQSSLC